MLNRWVLISLISLISTSVQAWELQYYGGATLGKVVLMKKYSEVSGALEDKDWPAASVTASTKGNITKAYAGVFLTKGLGARVSYINLGESTVDLFSGIPAGDEDEFINDTLEVLPAMGTGFAVSIQGRFQISDRLVFHDWGGLFIWNSEATVTLNDKIVTASRDGVDFLFGGAVEYLVGRSDQFGLRLEGERYGQDGDGVYIIGLGLSYYFN